MTRTRVVAIALATFVAALAMPALPADAGIIPTLVGEETCDTETGEYELLFTAVNPSDVNEASVTVDSFLVDGVETPLAFSPNPMPAGESTTATATVSGDTTSIFLAITVTFSSPPELEMTLDGDCEGPAATTTTLGATTTTPAVAAVPLERAPTFTG